MFFCNALNLCIYPLKSFQECLYFTTFVLEIKRPEKQSYPKLCVCPYLLLATSSAVPDSVSPALVKRGDCSRQRTWYQWVRGSVGAVDSHIVIL